MNPLKPCRPDKRYAPSGIITAEHLPDGGCALSGLPKRAFSDTGAALYLQYESEGGVSPLKSANRSGNDKVWTP
ncbi:hypothetical protein, partial [Kosakonia cowanii]|uniref:hypothetical protein n=1 Tax=Kosakonia cowanii TaxID=208223 RepID=UPI00289A273E